MPSGSSSCAAHFRAAGSFPPIAPDRLQLAGELLQIRFAYGPQQIGKYMMSLSLGSIGMIFKSSTTSSCVSIGRGLLVVVCGRCRCAGRGGMTLVGRDDGDAAGAGNGADQVPVSGLGRLIVGK